MGLFGKLHTAEHQGREAARQGFTRARNTLEEAQSRLRRKMRLYPRSPRPVPAFVTLQEREEEPPQPIVTINGEDLPPEDAQTPEKQVA